MSKSSTLTCSAGINLQLLRWNSFSQAATVQFTALSASATPATFLAYFSEGGQYPSLTFRIGFVGALPPWIQPGAAVQVVASITGGTLNRSYDISGAFIVENIGATGGNGWFEFTTQSRQRSGITTTWASTGVDSGSGVQPNPSVSLVMQCQRAVFGCSSGSVVIAPNADTAGNAPSAVTLVAGGQEYFHEAPISSKFDLADWVVKTAGAGTLYVKFI